MLESAVNINKEERKNPQTLEERLEEMSLAGLRALLMNINANRILDKENTFRNTGFSTITELQEKHIEELIKIKEAARQSPVEKKDRTNVKEKRALRNVSWLVTTAVAIFLGSVSVLTNPLQNERFSAVTLANQGRIVSSPVVQRAVKDFVRNEAARQAYNYTGIETQGPPVAKKASFGQRIWSLFTK